MTPTRTEHGLKFGAADVSCMASDKRTGNVYLSLETPKHKFTFRITKTGRVHIYTNGFEVMHAR